nr:MAG TPA: hypothetical protein [Bacteriophage sp.]
MLTVLWRFSGMARKVICRSKTLRETDSRRFQMQGSIPCSPTSESVRLVSATGLRDYPRLFGR